MADAPDHAHRFTGARKSIVSWCPECDATEVEAMADALRVVVQRVGFAAMSGRVTETEAAVASIAHEALVATGRLMQHACVAALPGHGGEVREVEVQGLAGPVLVWLCENHVRGAVACPDCHFPIVEPGSSCEGAHTVPSAPRGSATP